MERCIGVPFCTGTQLRMIILNSEYSNCADSASSFEKVELAGSHDAPHVQDTRRYRLFRGRQSLGGLAQASSRRQALSSTCLTVIRIPRIVGSPPHTSGLIVIRSICMCLFYKNLGRTQSDFNNPFRPRMCRDASRPTRRAHFDVSRIPETF